MIIKPAVPAAEPTGPVEFTAVADVLDLAATLVRTRGELGETSSRDKRPRIRHAIDRATTLTTVDPTRVAATRQWAALLAAEHINLARCEQPSCGSHDPCRSTGHPPDSSTR